MDPARIDGKDAELEAALGYVFRRRELLARALTHSSLAYEQVSAQAAAPPAQAKKQAKSPSRNHKKTRHQVEDNEQLEFLGDAVLGLVAAEALYRAHPEMTEGQLTRLRSALVSRKHMAQVAQRLDLGRYLHMGRGEERSGGRKKNALLANAAEAIIAAVYLDAATPQAPHLGLEAARRLIQTHVIDPSLPALLIEAAAGPNIGDYKSTLQEFLQSERRGQPEYVVTGQTGPDHRKRFLVEVRIPGLHETRLARGIGNTKKHAEQEAARRALLKLRSTPLPNHAQSGPANSASGGDA